MQGGETAEDHALVVGPGRAAVVRAGGGEPVVDQAGRADHAASVQPLPLPQRPVSVLLLAGYPGGEQRGEGEEQFVGDRVLVVPLLVPPQPAAAGVIPAAQAVREDGLRRDPVPLVPG